MSCFGLAAVYCGHDASQLLAPGLLRLTHTSVGPLHECHLPFGPAPRHTFSQVPFQSSPSLSRRCQVELGQLPIEGRVLVAQAGLTVLACLHRCSLTGHYDIGCPVCVESRQEQSAEVHKEKQV